MRIPREKVKPLRADACIGAQAHKRHSPRSPDLEPFSCADAAGRSATNPKRRHSRLNGGFITRLDEHQGLHAQARLVLGQPGDADPVKRAAAASGKTTS